MTVRDRGDWFAARQYAARDVARRDALAYVATWPHRSAVANAPAGFEDSRYWSPYYDNPGRGGVLRNALVLALASLVDAEPEDGAVLAPRYWTRAPQTDDPTGIRLPAVIWQTLGAAGPRDLIDDPSEAFATAFEIECRSPTPDGAAAMAAAVLAELRETSRLAAVTADYDEPDDASQQRGKYFSRVLEVAIA